MCSDIAAVACPRCFRLLFRNNRNAIAARSSIIGIPTPRPTPNPVFVVLSRPEEEAAGDVPEDATELLTVEALRLVLDALLPELLVEVFRVEDPVVEADLPCDVAGAPLAVLEATLLAPLFSEDTIELAIPLVVADGLTGIAVTVDAADDDAELVPLDADAAELVPPGNPVIVAEAGIKLLGRTLK